ncbi:unnamed protein product [Staurois parvus]|uniref:Uncharacterized protein n=1 Tax=Staurois parvus TaxID=386267 RepID=A0ABN9EWY0_9NEOB|nr:unnamed protein product [Staurois parvus]
MTGIVHYELLQFEKKQMKLFDQDALTYLQGCLGKMPKNWPKTVYK